MRIWVASDLHVEYKQNLEWLEGLSLTEYKADTLIVAGDVGQSFEAISKAFFILVARFEAVFFTPGNHDLWVTKQEREQGVDSLSRLAEIIALCDKLGVHTRPKRMGKVWIVPIYSWYHNCFDSEPDLAIPPGFAKLAQTVLPVDVACSDYRLCHWPAGVTRTLHNSKDPGADILARHFDRMNEPTLSNLETVLEMELAEEDPPDVITFSHFLPRIELMPEKRMLFYPNLPKAVGSCLVEDRLRALGSNAHVFGHTHFLWDTDIDGVRYLQYSLGSPKEQLRRNPFGEIAELFLLYDSELEGFSPLSKYYWSEYYRNNKRDPANPAMAPYTAKIYCPEGPTVHLPISTKMASMLEAQGENNSKQEVFLRA